MSRLQGTIRSSVPAATAWLLLSSFLSPRCAAQDTFSGTAPKPTFTQSVKQSFNKMGEAISPKQNTNSLPSDDPTLLSSEAKPSVELYLSLAKYYEESNKPAEAEQQYRKALHEKPNHLAVMLSYAHFLENQGRYEEAVDYYQRTIKAHPKDAAVYNNLGLCHARKKKLKEATAALGQAVQLEPRNPLYRNNISALLVEQNRLQDAFEQLRSVHGEAKAYYNLGYLLSKKGDTAAAEHHFKQALLIDPTMEPAERWLSYLQNKAQPSPIDRNFKIIHPTPSRSGNPPQEQMATRLAPPPATSSGPTSAPQQNPFYTQQRQSVPSGTFTQEPQTLPDSALPKRLPPVGVRQPAGSATPRSASDSSVASPAAPLPPEILAP